MLGLCTFQAEICQRGCVAHGCQTPKETHRQCPLTEGHDATSEAILTNAEHSGPVSELLLAGSTNRGMRYALSLGCNQKNTERDKVYETSVLKSSGWQPRKILNSFPPMDTTEAQLHAHWPLQEGTWTLGNSFHHEGKDSSRTSRGRGSRLAGSPHPRLGDPQIGKEPKGMNPLHEE